MTEGALAQKAIYRLVRASSGSKRKTDPGRRVGALGTESPYRCGPFPRPAYQTDRMVTVPDVTSTSQ